MEGNIFPYDLWVVVCRKVILRFFWYCFFSRLISNYASFDWCIVLSTSCDLMNHPGSTKSVHQSTPFESPTCMSEFTFYLPTRPQGPSVTPQEWWLFVAFCSMFDSLFDEVRSCVRIIDYLSHFYLPKNTQGPSVTLPGMMIFRCFLFDVWLTFRWVAILCTCLCWVQMLAKIARSASSLQ